MRWRGRRESSNVEDRRGQGGGIPGGFGRGGRGIPIPIGRAGGGGISGILLLVVLFFVLRACGIDPMQILEGGPVNPQVSEQSAPGAQPTDEEGQFVSVVLAETEDVWNGIFQAEGQTYREPTMVLFTDQVQSACGFASSASGPFYCPGDSRVYIDLGFFRELSQRFGASGDFAQAYVIAHEVGHHVQNLIGVLPEFNRQRQSMSPTQANEMSMRVELQADCFAGIWAHYTDQKGLLEEGDIEEALNAAHQIGDDTLQRRTQGYVVPESFNHGTSEQRMTWFSNGFRNGRLEDCDTFNNDI
ncbi:flagellar biosynthesis protein FlgM [Mesorhizobium microcysteis]|jgi:predicted metalloprotease|uniref:Flagellar biosynthesis protein FlgM n=1 Tax=Neoaquamicrobium microcysteis TaxID=2682781 RepID=A0A5D4GQB2_9HYPH|nr:neutral zinc metallopeptidase [Mesorhizobium microcysteis]TYR30518.1 flagellar biosynthesis protein FlgM [Mesorhizobium microcysteis]